MEISPVVLVMAALAVIAVCAVVIYGNVAEKRKAELAAFQTFSPTNR
jgi:predicted porin